MKFADTSFWFSLQQRRDRHHEDARALARAESGRVLTSNHVVGETWTLMRRRAGHAAAVGFLDILHRLPNVEVAWPDAKVEADAWRWLRRHDEHPYSFVDATSFALMRKRRIREALAFDGDFSAGGLSRSVLASGKPAALRFPKKQWRSIQPQTWLDLQPPGLVTLQERQPATMTV